MCTVLLHSLFAPLTGIEVQGTHVEGSVLIVEVGLSINLASLTMDQVLSKRRKVVADMCEQLEISTRTEAVTDAWAPLKTQPAQGMAPSVPPVVERFLVERLRPVSQRDPTHYNEDAQLGDAIQEVVVLASNVGGWAHGLAELAKLVGENIEDLVLRDSLDMQAGAIVSMQVVCGLCALTWLRPTLALDLMRTKLEPACAVALFSAFQADAVTSLKLGGTNFTLGGGSLDGLSKLCYVLGDGSCTIGELDLSELSLGVDAAMLLGEAIKSSASLTSINLKENELGAEGAKHIAEGIAVSASLTSIDLSMNSINGEGAEYVAAGISVSASLTSINLSDNKLGPEGAKHIAKGISVSASLTNVLAF